MSNGPVQVGDSWYLWGQGTDGDSLTLETTGLTLNGLTLFRIVGGTPAGSGELLVEDGAMELLFDDDTGDVLYEG